MSKRKPEKFKESLKSWDTENFLDRHFYRPVAYQIAVLLKNTHITPNIVTIISIFVGIGGCLMFYPDNLIINLAGFCILVFANILDCVDGQLARLTGIKSELGRILDGFCGDMWFLTLYLVFSFRLINFEGWGWWTLVIALLSAYSHFNQAGMMDYYKTLHLHFLKNGKNSEFESADSIKNRYEKMTWKDQGVSKMFLKLYTIYTLNQQRSTPELRKYVNKLNSEYPEGYPDEVVSSFRSESLKMMPLLDSFAFNTRSIVMLITLLFGLPWIYFGFEILILNPLLFIAIRRHEIMCANLNK